MIKRFDECDRILINILKPQDKWLLNLAEILKNKPKKCLQNLMLYLKIGASKGDLIQIQIWLANMQDFDAMNEIYDAWIKNYPMVGSALAEGYLVEIQAFGKLREN